MDKLVSTLAFSLGLDPSVVFFPEKLGSASARFTLGVMGRTIRRRLRQRAELMSFMWEHFVACEVAAGRLRPCGADNWLSVRWVPLRDLTIDAGREISGTINAVREGLADADRWCMSTEGKTQREILRERAENIRYAQELAAELGVALADIMPGAVGATSAPVSGEAPAADERNE
jgi:capsid protein